MVSHSELLAPEVRAAIRKRSIQFAGNANLQIYGKLNCKSGKRMKTINRVFFCDENEALAKGYRPCGHCMKAAFSRWKENNLKIDNSY